jgi:uncharacterized protein (DUF1778 family)
MKLSIPPVEPNLINCAAESVGKTSIDSVAEAVRGAAEDALLDGALMVVSSDAYRKFLKRIDRAPQLNERLQRTMGSKAW